MNLRILIAAVSLLTALAGTLSAQSYREVVYVVLLDVKTPEQIAMCHTEDFDARRARYEFGFEDPVNNLSDFSLEEDEIPAANCFVPEIKLLFKDYTYVLSMHCARAKKYQNSAPFKTSSVQLRNDLIFTESVYDCVNRLRRRFFGEATGSQALVAKTIAVEPLSDEVESDLDPYLQGDDIEEDELDFEDQQLLDRDDGEDLDVRSINDEELDDDDDGGGKQKRP